MTRRRGPQRARERRRRTRLKAEGGRHFAITVFALFAGFAALAVVTWSDWRQGLAAAGFLVGAGLMLARPGIESRRQLRFAIPPGGAERAVLLLSGAASIALIRLAQITAGTDNPPAYLLTAFLCWCLSLGAAWSSSSLPEGELPHS